MRRREFFQWFTVSLAGGTLLASCQRIVQNNTCSRTGCFTLWQLPSQTTSQMNSYILLSNSGEVVVIDGGMRGDAPYLKGFLAALGNQVQAWFVSHPHPDHIGALTALLEVSDELNINTIYGSLPTEDWVKAHETGMLPTLQKFNQVLVECEVQYAELDEGRIIQIDGICFEIMGVKNPEITSNAVNNSSLVTRVWDSNKSVLFTGDLGIEGGQKLLNSPYRKKLGADYIQMAHHGQNGVDEVFYQAVQPKYCLWPTPPWLWDNDSGQGKGSGPWDTLRVREWMKRLNVKKHYISGSGLCRID